MFLKEAINNTFTKRESLNYLKDYKQIINSISTSDRMKKQWQIYSNKYKYANDVEFSKILNLLEEILKELELEIVSV